MKLEAETSATAAAAEGDPFDTGVTVLVIIVNFRTPDLTLDCLRSVASRTGEVASLRAVVVDNGSGDGSAERIAAAIESNAWSSWASLEAVDENLGFGRGVNHGYASAPAARYVLILNSDAQLHDGTLRYCHDRLEDDPTIGAFSCLVLNADGSVQNVARRSPTPLTLCLQTMGLPYRFPRLFGWANAEDLGWDRRVTVRDVDWLGGAFLFLRAGLIERIGLFDEAFFFFGEDVEFCYRVRRAGFRCRYDPGASITHLGAGSSDETKMASEWRMRQLWWARYRVTRKCYGRSAEALVRGVDWTVFLVRACTRRLRRGADDPETRQVYELLRLLRNV